MKERSKELKTLQNAMGLGLLLIHRIFFLCIQMIFQIYDH